MFSDWATDTVSAGASLGPVMKSSESSRLKTKVDVINHSQRPSLEAGIGEIIASAVK